MIDDYINTIKTDRTLDVVFSRFRGFSFTITQRSYVKAALNYKTEREHARNSSGPMSQDYCKRKPLNLEKTTSSVLSVLLLIFRKMLVRRIIDKKSSLLY